MEKSTKKSAFNIKLFIVNLLTFSWTVFFTFQIGIHYNRPCKIIAKNQSEHLHKGSYKPDYYVNVQWIDRDRQTEILSIDGSTYFGHEKGSILYFRRPIASFAWLYDSPGLILSLGIVFLWFCGLSWSMTNFLTGNLENASLD